MKTRKTKTSQKGISPNQFEKRERPVMTVDFERYAHMLEDSDLTEEQKRELLQALWNITVEFVSLGFGVHPIQQAKEACGKPTEKSSNSALTASDTVYLDQSILSQFFEASDLETDADAEGVE